IADEDLVVSVSRDRYVKAVPLDTYRRQGRGGRGVRGAALKEGDIVEHLITTTSHAYLLLFSSNGRVYRVKAHEIPKRDRTARGYGKRTNLAHFPRKGRGGKGVIAAKITKPRGSIIAAGAVRTGDEVFLISDDGVVIRMAVDTISRQGRPTTGVRLMDVKGG